MSPYFLFINIFIYICISNVGLLWMKLDTEGRRQDGSFPVGVIMILITEFCLYVASNLDMQANKRHGCVEVVTVTHQPFCLWGKTQG